jgi:hypothetical protein
MPSFTVTAAAPSVALEQTGGGRAAFTVTNTTAAPVTARLAVTPQAPAAATWFTVAEPSMRSFAPNTTESVAAQIVVPAGTTPGTYAFRLDAIAESNPDEDFTEGPPVSFEVKPPAVKADKPFPWWILIIVALVLLGGGAAFALTRGGGKPGTPKITALSFTVRPVPATTMHVLWSVAKGADKYEVQVQKCSATPCTDANATGLGTDASNTASPDQTSVDVSLVRPVNGRVRVVSLKGSTKGDPSEWRSFGLPSVETAPASDVVVGQATLGGSVTPAGAPVQVHVELGLTTNYGLSTPVQSLAASETQTAFSTAVSGLPPGTLHYRAVATSDFGTFAGPDTSVQIPGPPPPYCEFLKFCVIQLHPGTLKFLETGH